MIADELLDSIFEKASENIDVISDGEIYSMLSDYNLDADDEQEIAEFIKSVRDSKSYDDEPEGMEGTTVTVAEDKDNDGDIDSVTTEEISEDSEKPHDEGLAGETTLEEELMLNPEMSKSEFSKLAAEKRGAKKGEPAPDMFTNVLSDNTQKNIINALSARRW